jgi:hypothetical protein
MSLRHWFKEFKAPTNTAGENLPDYLAAAVLEFFIDHLFTFFSEDMP